MNNILSEKDYQKFLLERLEQDNGFVVRKARNYDRLFAMDREMLFKFLNDTQPDTMDYLRKIYKADLEDTVVSFINAEVTKARGSLVEVLKHGVEIANRKLDLMYTKPATAFNPELTKKYGQNIFSVMEEVWASDKERIDLVVFLNGLAIMSFELKCNMAGQSYQDAIYQYRTERDPKTRLFLFKAGTLVNFAMDLEQVYMTTRLAGEATFFLPFNMGDGHGVTAGAGNPAFEDRYSVSYMWEDILTKDMLPVDTKEHLERLNPNFKNMVNLCCDQDVVGIHAFALTGGTETTAICRNFAPRYGINEESATGTSSCALACYLFQHYKRQSQYVFEQGFNLGSASRLVVNITHQGGSIDAVHVGGYGHLVCKKMLLI